MDPIEIVGYIGSALVLASFLMTSVVKLRLVNVVGSAISGTYSLIVQAYPVALLNICLVLINLHFLWKARATGRTYELVEVSPDDDFLAYLVGRWGEDIRSIFPTINLKSALADANTAYVTMFEDAPVAIAAGTHEGEELTLSLDYAAPAYRDLSIGTSFFAKLAENGVREVRYEGPVENHRDYLKAMGFEEHNDTWNKVL